jgi:parallel beta-helix repeat protein
MKGKLGRLIPVFIFALVFCTCNNFFHDLIPPDDNRITRFEIDGQIGKARIGPNTVDVTVAKGTELSSVIPRISVSHKASLIPMTMDYVRAAFPGIDFLKAVMRLYETSDIAGYVNDLIRENPGFNVPALKLPVDLTGPVTFLVISGQGSMRQYMVNIEIDTGEPKLSGFSFAKYDNPELITDSRGEINEPNLTVIATAVYPMEMDYLSYALIPSFQIMGERLEIDGVEIVSGETEIQFEKMLGEQNKTVTVWREGVSKKYVLTVTFVEDPDSIRSIIDFRFYKTDNSRIAANAVASIVNTGDTGTITVQVYYSGEKPQTLIPSFITPGRASVAGVQQTSRASAQDFSVPLEYRVVSRNGLYTRLYTVKVEFISLVSVAPRITSFRFNQNINHELVQDTVGEISDGLIMIDAYYGGAYPPDTLIPEFTAQGIVTVMGSVQISGASSQSFNRQIRYTVTNPENPALTRDYWVQTRMTRDVSADAKITAFGFYPEDNEGLADPVIGRVDQVTGKITLFASPGSGVTERIMYPRFEAVGQVSVGGIIQSSRTSPQTFNVPIIYTVTSANGNNSRNYTVEVRELKSTIFVNRNALGRNDGTSWQDAFDSLKTACETAALFPGDIPKEIWIAAGTYTPGSSATDYFPLTANTSYIGGFAGNETAKSQRNVAANKVTVSGVLGGGVYSNNLFGLFGDNIALTVNGDLAFEDLELTGAKANLSGARGNGAAICAVLPGGAVLNISRCNFNGFTATGSGGAVYTSGGNAVVADTIIENVQAGDGGGISLRGGGNHEISNVTIDNAQSRGYGGAVYATDISTLKISNSSITNANWSITVIGGGMTTVDGLTLRDITGKGIYIYNGGVFLSGIDADGISGDAVDCRITGGQVRIGDSKFSNTGMVNVVSSVPVYVTDTEIRNSSGYFSLYVGGSNGGENGGMVTIEGVTIDGVPGGVGIGLSTDNSVVITGSSIKNCSREGWNGGGGIHIYSSFSPRYVEISDVIIENCTGGWSGGGYLSSSGDNSEISNVIIKNCTAGNQGGGISGSNFKISDVTIENCTAEKYGGGISGDNSEISNVIIKNCTAGEGGGGILGNNIKISDVTIENCTAGERGGGILGNNIKISDVTIKNCTADSRGGGIYLGDSSGNDVISNVTIDNVQADNGGAVYKYSGGSLVINNSSITNARSSSSNDGGGIHSNRSGVLTVNGLVLRDITGRGISKTIDSTLLTSGGVSLSGIDADGISGDAVYCSGIDGSASIGNSKFNNTRRVYISSSVSVQVTDTEISNNSGDSALYVSSGTATIDNVTIDGVPNGRGIYVSSANSVQISDSEIRNCIITGSGGGLYHNGEGKLVITNSRFESCISGTYGAIYVNSSSGAHEITGTDFINCTSRNGYKILASVDFASISDCTFTHDSNLADLGSPSVGDNSVVSVFGFGGGNFDGCTFNYLRNNRTTRNFLFDAWGLRYDDAGSGSQYHIRELTLRDCTFYFNSASAGLLAWGTSFDDCYILMDNCRITNNGGQQPLIWLDGNNVPNVFRFSLINYYNGNLLNSQMASLGTSGVILLTNGATPVIVP